MRCGRRIKLLSTSKKMHNKKYLFLFVVVAVYVVLSTQIFSPWTRQLHEQTSKPCYEYEQNLQRITRMGDNVHDALEAVGVNHFLIYGSIWGHVRGFHGPLPWDYDIDFATTDPHFSVGILDRLQMELAKYNLTLKNELFSAGLIKFVPVNDPKSRFRVELFFYKKGWFRRVGRTGLEPWILPIHYWLHHTFPERLLSPPLSKVRFGGRDIQVPHGGLEVLKYLYRANWHKEMKPDGYKC